MFEGDILHTKDVQEGVFSSLVGARERRIVVIGGSKSACDMVYSLHSAGVGRERVTWLFRRPYTFFRRVPRLRFARLPQASSRTPEPFSCAPLLNPCRNESFIHATALGTPH